MANVHIQPTSAVVRWYDHPDGYEQKMPFKAVASLTYLGDNQVFMHGMHGQIDKDDMRVLFELFVERGISTLIAERRGKFVTRDIKDLLEKDRARSQ